MKVYTTARVDIMSALVGTTARVGTTAKVSITAIGGMDGGVGWRDRMEGGKGGGRVGGRVESLKRGVRVEKRGCRERRVDRGGEGRGGERGKYRWRLKVGEELGSVEEVGRGGE